MTALWLMIVIMFVGSTYQGYDLAESSIIYVFCNPVVIQLRNIENMTHVVRDKVIRPWPTFTI